MSRSGYEPRPMVLLRIFNSRYHGRSVSFQSVSRWLGGKAIPGQDKLQVLATIFGIEPQVLRFGRSGCHVNDSSDTLLQGVGWRERQVIEGFLALTPSQRELIGALVDALLGLH